ncbi:hypothetical protein CAEBREN_03667 [Caenorhabditis brenneri]|uniref:F-box domain-containing protein n=1 Tax=Caenorhabditis brenneri TaxID=135651 RepID=G0NSK5_CAEBE|nr:hypothetical protein CAEBREN_03667 [Caenorhabditis brenneri]
MPFNFMKFPYPVKQNLVDQMSNVDLVRVSLQSQKADNALKECGKMDVSFFKLTGEEMEKLEEFDILELFLSEAQRQVVLPDWNVEFHCCLNSNPFFSIACTHFHVRVFIESIENIRKTVGIVRKLKIGESFVPVVTVEYGEEPKILTFWNDKAAGMNSIMDCFKSNFDFMITELFIDGIDSETLRPVVNHINSTHILVINVQVGSFFSSLLDDDFKFILKNVSAIENFVCQLDLTQNFEYDGNILAKRVRINTGNWFKLHNILMSTENEEIFAYGTNFTKKDVQKFLKEWKAGKFPKLKELRLDTKCRNETVKIKGRGNTYGQVHSGYIFWMEVHDNEE